MNICQLFFYCSSAASGHHANIQVWRRDRLCIFCSHTDFYVSLFVAGEKELGYVVLCSAHSFNTKRQSGPLKGRSFLVKTQKRSHSDVTQQCSRALLHFLLNLWEMLFELEKSGDAAFDFMESLAAGVTRLEDSDQFFFLYIYDNTLNCAADFHCISHITYRARVVHGENHLLTLYSNVERGEVVSRGRRTQPGGHKRQSSKYFWALTSYGPRPPPLIYSRAVVWTSRGTSTFLEACLDGDRV